MRMHATGLAFLFILAASAAPVHAQDRIDKDAPSIDDSDAPLEKYKSAQILLFDALRNDSSPRQQVLAGRIYISSDDETPAALRPKGADVVARAAQLAPDDVFVQWQAAAQGSYFSSACGPTRRPEGEVANLLRLEPDNAAALQFAVALAQAKDDQVAIDDALSRMAAASGADDHLTDELAAWTKAHVAHPEADNPLTDIWHQANATPQAKALLSALSHLSYRSSSTSSELETACKPDGASDRTWQRLGWCADAARLFATKGSSLQLREQGLKLLATTGDHSDATAELQRQYDWLEAHGANPMQNAEAMSDAPTDVQSDWQGASSEVAAIEHRLKRTGQPLTPPSGWTKEIRADEESSGDSNDVAVLRKSYADYLKGLMGDMRGSADVREQALALGPGLAFVVAIAADEEADKADPKSNTAAAALADLAAANPDNLFVQWIAAVSTDGANSVATSSAIARTQRLDADNAAAWALSLSRDTPMAESSRILQHMAAGKRYDVHGAEILAVALTAARRHPMAPELADALGAVSPEQGSSSDAMTAGVAMMLAYSTFGAAPAITAVCSAAVASSEQVRRNNCIAVGHLMLHEGRSLVDVSIGEILLRQLEALGPSDENRARQVAWWHSASTPKVMFGSDGGVTYFNDFISSGSEIEATRLAAKRLGKAEPPADWKSPAEKRASLRAKHG